MIMCVESKVPNHLFIVSTVGGLRLSLLEEELWLACESLEVLWLSGEVQEQVGLEVVRGRGLVRVSLKKALLQHSSSWFYLIVYHIAW